MILTLDHFRCNGARACRVSSLPQLLVRVVHMVRAFQVHHGRLRRRLACVGLICVFAGSALAGDDAPPVPGGATIEALEAVLEQPFACADPELVARAWATGGPSERLAAAVLELRASPANERLELLADYVRRASVTDLRRLVDSAPRPMAKGFAPLVGVIAGRPHVAATELAADLAAALERPTAQDVLLELARNPDPMLPERDRAPVWAALASAGDDVAARAAIADLSEPGALGAAARSTVLALAERAMAQARIEDGVALLSAAATAAPRDRGIVLRLAAGLGLYLDRSGDARAILDELRIRAAVDLRSPALAKEDAEARLGLAALALLAGDHSAATDQVDRAIRRFGEPREHRRDRKVVRCRLELMRALILLHAGDAGAADAGLEHAILHAPFEQDYCTFDDAMTGPFGPAAVLDLLRRRGEGEFVVTYFAALTGAMTRVASTSTIRIGLAPIAGPVNGAEASDDRSRVKSWQYLRYAEALLAVGRSDEAAAAATGALAVLDGTEPWVNRWLEAELRIVLARAQIDLEQPRDAVRALEAAASTLRQIGELSILAEIEDVHDRAPEGTPPLRSPVRDREAAALVLRARVESAIGNDASAREAKAAAWKVAPMSDDVVLLCAATTADPALAARVLASIPTTGGNLAGLARVAAQHGNPDDAVVWLERLDGWNAVAPRRAALDRAAFRRDPAFAPLRELERFRKLVGDAP